MSITVEIGELERVVDRLVQSGRYVSRDAALAQSVRLLEAGEADLAALHDKLDVALRELDAGLGIPGKQVRAQLVARFAVPDADE